VTHTEGKVLKIFPILLKKLLKCLNWLCFTQE